MESTEKLLDLVSIITINFNGLDDTLELYESLKKITYPNIEFIIVDNGSDVIPQIDSFKELNTQIILNNENLGFAVANNIGIKAAQGEYCFLVNNDVVVKPEFLEPLVQYLNKDAQVGMASPKIYYYDEPNKIQYAGFTDINPLTIRNKGIGFNEIDEGKYNQPKGTFYAFGAALIVRKSAIEKVGLMSDKFFLYYEEMDWCKRFRNHGYKLMYIPNSVVYHKDSSTIGAESPTKTYYINRGRLLYLRRNVKFPLLLISSAYQLLIAFPKNYLKYILSGNLKHARAYKNSMGWFIKNFFNKKSWQG